jgi:outer membrane protein OmpA-like peptidoglycan-associated protein
MDSVNTYMSLNPDSRLTIVGHTDSIDTDKFNYRLGLDRAENTKKYMEELGVNASRIDVASEGESKPVAPNRTDEGRQKNRRVEFIIQEES